MARSNISVEELLAISRDLSSASSVVKRAADELEKAGLQSVPAHSSMLTSTYLPAVTGFASDVLSAAIQTSLAAETGRQTKMAGDMARARVRDYDGAVLGQGYFPTRSRF